MLFIDKHISDIKKTEGTIIIPVRIIVTTNGRKSFQLESDICGYSWPWVVVKCKSAL